MTRSAPAPTGTGTAFRGTVAAPLGFLAAYLAVGPVSGAFADGGLPLPGAPAAEVARWFAANPVPVGITAVLQVVSVVCLSAFAVARTPALRAAGAAWVARLAHLSTVAMVVSSLLSVTLAVVVGTGGVDGGATVEVLRQASFHAGGVITVVALGGFVLGAAVLLGRERLFGAPTRWFGVVAGAIAVASVASLAFYYASVALPVGRVLSMVWTVVAGVVVWRRVRAVGHRAVAG